MNNLIIVGILIVVYLVGILIIVYRPKQQYLWYCQPSTNSVSAQQQYG